MKAEDFHVGQKVVVPKPEDFVGPVCAYLKDRVGVVTVVWPSTGDRDTALRRNQVQVLWGKRNGRGKEKSMIMGPKWIAPAEAS